MQGRGEGGEERKGRGRNEERTKGKRRGKGCVMAVGGMDDPGEGKCPRGKNIWGSPDPHAELQVSTCGVYDL